MFITTDQGSQFTSEILKQLTIDYQIKHHIAVIEVHHNIGSIERTNRQIIELFKSIMTELFREVNQWKIVFGLVQFALNNYKSQKLNGNSPITVFTNLPLSSEFIEKIIENKLTIVQDGKWIDMFNSKIKQLQLDFENLKEKVNKTKNKRDIQSKNSRKNKKRVIFEEFPICSWVYVIINSNLKHSKLQKNCFGTCQVLGKVIPSSNYRYWVKDIIENKKYYVHIERMKSFAKELKLTDTLKMHMSHNGDGYDVKEILNHKLAGKGLKFLVVRIPKDLSILGFTPH